MKTSIKITLLSMFIMLSFSSCDDGGIEPNTPAIGTGHSSQINYETIEGSRNPKGTSAQTGSVGDASRGHVK